MEEDRIISPELENSGEERLENSLRPKTLEEYIGQDKIKENMTADESDLVGSEEENAYSYSFRKTVVSETEINCNGTVVIGKLSVPVSFTIGKTSETDVWSFSEISIDSKKISDNTVNKINDPYIVM